MKNAVFTAFGVSLLAQLSLLIIVERVACRQDGGQLSNFVVGVIGSDARLNLSLACTRFDFIFKCNNINAFMHRNGYDR